MSKHLPATLPSDWPEDFVCLVKTRSLYYVTDMREPWPDPEVRREHHVGELNVAIARSMADDEGLVEESWETRYENAETDAELHAALEFYAQVISTALRHA